MSTPAAYTNTMDEFMREGILQLRSTLSELIDVNEHLEGVLSKVREHRASQEPAIPVQVLTRDENQPLIVPPEWAIDESARLSGESPSLLKI
ncbi:hypothetical protein EASAB2608_03731 [Streptomyces sp. EAS-AB2608]|nr:hypothetical protein EASAB2608_03731 [Streptomyces sp. EAS-AB2608]